MRVTPERTAEVAHKIEVLLNRDVIHRWVDYFTRVMICERGYNRPTGSRLQSCNERQGIPTLPHSEGLLVSEEKFIGPHVHAALNLEHPFADIATTSMPDLAAAVKWVASFRGPCASENISDQRHQMARDMRECSHALRRAGIQGELERLRCEYAEPSVAQSAPPCEMALWAVLIRARGWPDLEYTL